MATIVYQTNKKTGVTYAYESTSYWDKEKQQSRAKRTCIGRLDPVTKQIVPNRPRKKPVVSEGRAKRGPVPITTAARSFYGATYFFDWIGSVTGVADDLRTCFPDTWRQILSIVYYLILEDRNPLSRFPRWAATHWHPHGSPISSQRSSELFASITEAERQRFFELQGHRRVEKEYLAYDSTSVSSYSKCLKQVRYGNNKDHEPLAQINLALLFGQQSRLPFYYRKLAGNIPDVKTLTKLLADMNTLGYRKIKVVLDRGFYSSANINELYRQHLKFLIGARLSLKLVKTNLDPIRETMRSWTHYSQTYQLYAYSLPITWAYTEERPYKGDTIRENRRLYLHLYYSPDRALEDEKAFNSRLADLQEELISNQRHADHEKLYDRNRQINPIWSKWPRNDHVCRKIFMEAYMEQRAETKYGSKHSYWQQHIDTWRQSGQSQQRYCQTHGLALATFGYWRRKLKKGSTEKPRFYPLVLSGQSLLRGTAQTNTASVRVVLGNNRFTVEIDEHFSPAVLRDVVTTLEQL
jgi:hypothetical protein